MLLPETKVDGLRPDVRTTVQYYKRHEYADKTDGKNRRQHGRGNGVWSQPARGEIINRAG